MNTDCTKPSVAPKPRFVCHASPLMSAARGPKPSIAPKPKVTPELNGRDVFFLGNQGGCINGGLQKSTGDEENGTQNGLNTVDAEKSPSDDCSSCVFESLQEDLQVVSQGPKDGEVTVDEKEEDMVQKMDEDWRLTDSILTEEADSLETLWVSDAGLTADSEDAVEMTDTDLNEEMDADGCDAGEALADTDGLSVGDISVNSIDEEANCCSAAKKPETENQGMKQRHEKLQIKEEETGDCTADDLTESLSDESGLLSSENTKAEGRERKLEEDSTRDCEVIPVNLKSSRKIKGKHEQNISFYELSREDQKQIPDRHIALHEVPSHEPYYFSSKDIINKELFLKSSKDHRLTESPGTTPKLLSSSGVPSCKYKKVTDEHLQCGKTTVNEQADYVSSEVYVEIGSSDKYSRDGTDENKVRTSQNRTSGRHEDHKVLTAEALLNHLDSQPRFRLVSISVPTDTDTSLTSSLSESQLLSPSDSDVFRDEDDLEGHIVPFLDDTTDVEQDFSDEHVYEEPGHLSDSENVYKMCSSSSSHRINNNLTDLGVQFGQWSSRSGFGQTGPALSSSPMLKTASRHTSYPKPHYLSLYPCSLSMEGQEMPLCVYRDADGSPMQKGAIFKTGSFSQRSPLSSSGLSTPTSVVDIPPPFELAYITKKPITKSSPSLLIEGDSSEKNRKKKSSIKRFLMLKFRRKTESKPVVDVSPSSQNPPEPSLHTPSRLISLDRHSLTSSPQLNSRSAIKPPLSSEPAFLLYKESKRKENSVAFLNRSVIRVESFEDRSRVPFTPLPLTKPRSISFPNTDTSDYENVPAISSDYENLQVPQRRPVRQVPFTDFFDRPSRVLSSANETDGYVDMSSLPGFESKTQSPEQEPESAYTEAYNVCAMAARPLTGGSMGNVGAEDDQGRTSEEEDGAPDANYDRQPDGRSRAFYIAKELVDAERLHVKALKLLQEDFREAVGTAVGDEGEPVLDDERLREILNELPDVYTLHRRILTELENRIRHWDESQRIADIFLSRKAEFLAFTTYIGHYDRSMSLLDDSCRTSPAFAAIVHQFEQSPAGEKVSLKHQLLQVIVRVAQYRMVLTDYLNNLSPDSKEYEDTQAAVTIVSDIADQVNDSLKHGENLLRLVNIEYSVRGQRDLLQPGRIFVKEGTLMKVSRKSRQPRHLFLMNDMLLYTYPQQDGKYRLKNTLSLTGLKVSKPILDNVQNALKIEGTDITITLSASSFIEREDWFYTLNHTVTEHARGSAPYSSRSGEVRDRLWLSLGEKAPTFVPVSQVVMCMNCTADFSLTLRRHHCHGCGRIVCRSCSRNRYPLKYMKDRMAKVCDHCYNELKKRGGDVSAQSSPRPNRSSRPLSAMFQNIHPPNIWRHRKGTLSFNQVSVSEEGSISGALQRSKRSKRNWKRLWFLLKDKVLYTYRAQEEKVASESLPLLGFTVKLPDRQQGLEEANVFQLYHKNTLYYTFKAEDNYTAQRWANAMEEATVL
ncbi:FYVE, RhoGEF and PH domain-containing protein 5b isoform X2 [Sphaeramia orbicularis]|uniref:FYVE, RhoGEF and PH domain-containing protein 5b isoform X2 n=1 Tax=Sphaeramia orbicularis TaxID=375764 RepID=UPI00117FC1E3|nr:FYVE, RhoGEF and PH domain-containing protein 5-like isoform X2 [Sphaeramia orbicularis]